MSLAPLKPSRNVAPNRPPLERKRAERALFFSLWVVLLLSIGLWKFRPNPNASAPLEGPKLLLANELTSIFERAEIAESTPTTFTVRLYPLAKYREILQGREQRLNLGYQFTNAQSALAAGTAPCVIHTDEDTTLVQLQNPERIFAQSIQFFLAH